MYIKAENETHIELLESLAKEIWTDHFGPMFENDILEYIISKIQSKESILEQIEEGYLYYFIHDKNIPVGYFAFQLSEKEKELFLGKLYIRSAQRRKGLGNQVVVYLKNYAKNPIYQKSPLKFTITTKAQSRLIKALASNRQALSG